MKLYFYHAPKKRKLRILSLGKNAIRDRSLRVKETNLYGCCVLRGEGTIT